MAKYNADVHLYEAEHPGYTAWLAAASKQSTATAEAKAKRRANPGKKRKDVHKEPKMKASGIISHSEVEESESCTVCTCGPTSLTCTEKLTLALCSISGKANTVSAHTACTGMSLSYSELPKLL